MSALLRPIQTDPIRQEENGRPYRTLQTSQGERVLQHHHYQLLDGCHFASAFLCGTLNDTQNVVALVGGTARSSPRGLTNCTLGSIPSRPAGQLPNTFTWRSGLVY